MKKLLQKVDRIRATGTVTLNLESDSPFYKYHGKIVKVHSMGIPDYKCRITVIIDGLEVDLTIDDIS